MHPSYSTRQAAELLGVSESTVRRWCDRQLLGMSRTSGGHRRIDLSVLLEFARRENIAVRSGAVDALEPASLAELSKTLYGYFADGDMLAVRRLITGATARAISPASLCDDVVAPALETVGDAWQRGRLDVFQEHAATRALEASLNALRDLGPRLGTSAPRAVCASLSHDPYSIGPTMAALVLSSEGFFPFLLGSDTPAVEIAKAAAAYGATIVSVSVGAVADRGAFVDQVGVLSKATSARGVGLALGGRALTRELRVQISADFFGDTMSHLARFARSQRRQFDETA